MIDPRRNIWGESGHYHLVVLNTNNKLNSRNPCYLIRNLFLVRSEGWGGGEEKSPSKHISFLNKRDNFNDKKAIRRPKIFPENLKFDIEKRVTTVLTGEFRWRTEDPAKPILNGRSEITALKWLTNVYL